MLSGVSGYESVEHTADLAIRAWAPDVPGLIEQAARGMLSLMLDHPPAASEHREITGEAPDAEELLVDCLRELLALVNIECLVPVSVDVIGVRGGRARCRAGVVSFHDGREALVQEIKAVTYHGLEVGRTEAGLEVTVVFDV